MAEEILGEANFGRKIDIFFSSMAPDRQLSRVMSEGVGSIRKYIGVKTVASLVTALLSYLIMSWCKLDYAAFWAESSSITSASCTSSSFDCI